MNSEAHGEFCTILEYHRGRETRIKPNDLRVHEVHLLMAALSAKQVYKRAVKLPALIDKVAETPDGLYTVQFNLLDADFQPVYDMTGTFQDGYWLDPKGRPLFKNRLATDGYFKNCENPFETDPWLQHKQLSIPTSL